jgi:N-acetylglucosaminyl-diphospho-decaprenol L-rhamnosyltransferase
MTSGERDPEPAAVAQAEPGPAEAGGVAGGTRLPLLAGIVVHWHNEALLGELVAAWPRDPRFELVVVDNGSSGGLTELDAAPARVLRPGRNLGFAGAVNAGAAATRAPLLLVLNPDAAPEPGALDRLLDGFSAHPEAAGLAPCLVGPAGEPQAAWQLRRLPSAWECVRQALPLPAPAGPRAPSPRGAAGTPAAGSAVEQPAAAALALRRSALAAVGGFDESFFPAWFEDVDLARRLRAAGLPLLYWPAARFRHRLGSTVPLLGYGPFVWVYHRNLERYLRKHHGPGWAWGVRAAVAAGAIAKLLLVPLRRPRRAASRGEGARGLLTLLFGALTGWRLPRTLAARSTAGAPAAGQAFGSPAAGPPEVAAFHPPPDGPPAVTVAIVTHNSARDLPHCLAAVGALEHRPLEIVVVDSGSQDGSLAAARAAAPAGIPFCGVGLAENVGFAAAMNAAVARARAPFFLTLNADARPTPAFVTRLLARIERHPELRVGAVAGRLVRLEAGEAGKEGRTEQDGGCSRSEAGPARVQAGPGCVEQAAESALVQAGPAEQAGKASAPGAGPRRLDACGMRLTRAWRHLDRGSGEVDRGQWGMADRVFGASGAASLFRRAALLDAAVEGEVFDPRFHSFREDAELCFRLRERGWEILYEPAAVAGHRRFNLPERRAAMPAHVNYHSLKNRYLLRIYHQTGRNLARNFLPTTARDLAALGYALLRERSSLGAYGWLWRHRGELRARRRAILGRRRVAPAALEAWFGRDGAPL